MDENNNILAGDVSKLKEFREIVEKNKTAKNMVDNMLIEEKKLDKELNLNKKNLKDNLDSTVKKRRSEVASNYDGEIAKEETKLKKIKDQRGKAKEKGVKERIADETADLVAQNKELKGNIRTELKGERLPAFCGSGFYYSLFFTKGAKEVFTFILTVIITCLVLPGGIYMLTPARHAKKVTASIVLALIYFIIIALFVFIYWAIHHNTKGKHEEGLKSIRQLRDRIDGNKKQIRKITNSIHKDKSEDMYGLDDFDAKIKEAEGEIKRINGEKEAALINFDEAIAPSIVAEIEAKEMPRINEMQSKLDQSISERESLEEVIKETALSITNNYEAYIGKNYTSTEAIDELIAIMDGGQAQTVSQAIDIYKVQP